MLYQNILSGSMGVVGNRTFFQRQLIGMRVGDRNTLYNMGVVKQGNAGRIADKQQQQECPEEKYNMFFSNIHIQSGQSYCIFVSWPTINLIVQETSCLP